MTCRLGGRPLSAPQLAALLRSLGIPARLARNSALIDLAAQLPAAVLSQLLGIHLQTATAWTIEAGNTWLRYAAALAAHPDTT
jgi:transglutaminase-like putative cysteine protease